MRLKKLFILLVYKTEEKTETQRGKKYIDISEDLNPELKSTVKDDLLSKPPRVNETEEIERDEFEITKPVTDETVNLSEELDIEEEVETIPLDPAEVEQPTQTNMKGKLNAKAKGNKDIISFLSAKEIQKIISSIFNEDKEDFATTIETISECKSYEKATEILKTLYTTYNVNPYSRDAILLTNAVAKYFTVA